MSAVTLEPDPDWWAHANCMGIDPELFFPERGASTRQAKAVCAACVVKDLCLQHALENVERFGIWGGTSERERRRIRKRLGIRKDRVLQPCGTTAAYDRHRKNGEEPCAPCRRAYNASRVRDVS